MATPDAAALTIKTVAKRLRSVIGADTGHYVALRVAHDYIAYALTGLAAGVDREIALAAILARLANQSEPATCKPSLQVGADRGPSPEVEALRAERDEAEAARWQAEMDAKSADYARLGDTYNAVAAELSAAEADAARLREENERLRLGKDRFKAGVRAAITWLHAHASTMNDTTARSVLDSAATNLGWDLAAGRVPDGALVDHAPTWTGSLSAGNGMVSAGGDDDHA